MAAVEAWQRALRGADQVHVGVRTRWGPHVTPDLFTLDGASVVCLASAASLKVKRLRRDPVAALAAIGAGGERVVALADVEVLDAYLPAGSTASVGTALAAPRGVARFARDNAAELVGAAVDWFSGRLGGPIPPRRVLLVLSPFATVVAGDGGLEHDGWLSLERPPADDGLDVDHDGDTPEAALGAVDDAASDVVASGPAVVGWLRTDGLPLAVPVEWDADASTAVVDEDLFDVLGAADDSPACVTFDASDALGPSGKRGLMLRGAGRARRRAGEVELRFDVDRVTTWDGVVTDTTDVA